MQKSLGGSLSAGADHVSGSVNMASSQTDSSFKSVTEQSAIKTGDGGFQIDVKGKTILKGGIIESTQRAIDRGSNQFFSAGGTELTDIENSASYEGSGYSVGVSVSANHDKDGNPVTTPGVSAGVGSTSGHASSTTYSGISGVTGKTDVRTGDAPTGIAPIFDAEKVNNEVNAKVTITQNFGSQASAAAGNYANGQYQAALLNNDADGMKQWGPDGTYRAVLHAGIGALTGGAAGAIGGAGASMAVPQTLRSH